MVSLSLTISVSRHSSSPPPFPPEQHQTQTQNQTSTSAAPSLRYNYSYTASLSSHSHSRSHSRCPSHTNSISTPQQNTYFSLPSSAPPVYGIKGSRNNSLERLLEGKKKRDWMSVVQFENGRLKRRMVGSTLDSPNGGGVEAEREKEGKKSYGIGGAGNIRRPSDVIYPVRTNADGSRRKPWSSITASPGKSVDGKRNGFLGFFRKGIVQHDVVNGDVDEDEDDVDSRVRKVEME